MASKWTQDAVTRLVHEDGLQKGIGMILREWLDSAEKLALEELRRLLEDERKSPLTYNHYYTDNVQKARLGLQRKAIKHSISRLTFEDDSGNRCFNQDIEEVVSHLQARITVDMDEQACIEAKTQLDAYYKVFSRQKSLKRPRLTLSRWR